MRSLAVVAVPIYFVVFLSVAFKDLNAIDLRFTNVRCKSLNESLTIFHECRLKIVRRGVVAMDARIVLLSIFEDVTVNVALYKKANSYSPFLYNTTMDFCKFKRTHSTNLFARIVFEAIEEHSNLNHTCPYKDEIVVRNLILENERFRLVPLPSGEYLIKLVGYESGMPIASADVFFYRHE